MHRFTTDIFSRFMALHKEIQVTFVGPNVRVLVGVLHQQTYTLGESAFDRKITMKNICILTIIQNQNSTIRLPG